MKAKAVILALLFLQIALMHCIPRSREPGRAMQVRYVFLPSLLEYLAKADPAAKEIEIKKTSLRKNIESLKEKIERGGSEIPEAVLKGDLKKYENEMKTALAEEEKIKAGYYRAIDSAIGTVARRIGADFVLNRGEELLYADKKYDITEKVIRELSSRKNRTAPHSR